MHGDEPAWTPTHVVSPELAAQLIEAHFPDLRPVRIGGTWSGWDNTAYQVNDDLIFRFPRREVAVPLMETEIRVLHKLASRLPLPIPVPVYAGTPSDDFPWPFAGYGHVPGTCLSEAGLGTNERAELARPLGEFLRALHAIDPAGLNLPPEGIGKLDFARRLPQAQERLNVLQVKEIIQPGHWQALLNESSALSWHPSSFIPHPLTVIHGDFYYRHVLVDDRGKLSGVIDWGDVCLGRPAIDLMAAWVMLSGQQRQAFLEAYGEVDEITWRQARLRALFHTAAVLDYAVDMNDETLLAEGQRAFQFLQEN
jgi:aminoglycoside phosphotransferase (APT) family kinase protein